MDKRLKKVIDTADKISKGEYSAKVRLKGDDDLNLLAQSINRLGSMLEKRFQEIETLSHVTEKINSGMLLEEVLNYTYDSFRPIIPYDRIGFALLENEGAVLRAHWARSDGKHVALKKGFSAKMQGSSLQKILETGEPRILNDLKSYLKKHPYSESTQKIVTEGIQSSLTCPLIITNKPIGFIFFSSLKPHTYHDIHVELFMQIAGQLSMIVEKSRLYQQLMELNSLKNKFLGIAVHDLRSPISVINCRLDLIMDGHLGSVTDKQLDSLKGIREWCTRMLNLVEELLDVSAIESGNLHLQKELTSIKKQIEESLQFNRVLAESKNIILKMDIEENIPDVILDPDRIHQVLNNLISNAIKYSEPKTEVIVSIIKQKKEIQISVKDNGQGILQNELKKVFNYFEKTSTQPTLGESSTGLGLAICKRLVEAHGGRIWVESKINKQTAFHFTLPFKDK